MKRKISLIITIVVIFTFLLNTFSNIGNHAKASSNKINMTYYYSYSKSDYTSLVDNTKNSLNYISPSYFDINDDGSLNLREDKIDTSVINNMHNRNVKVIPFLSNHWDKQKGKNALNNVGNLSNDIVNAIEKHNLDGVNVDIENVTEMERSKYVELVKALREKLPEDKSVSVAVAANPNGWNKGWHGSYDDYNLAKYSDFIVIMTYDESWDGSNPGPVASYTFVEESIKYALNQGVPSSKIVLGIPFYGRIWNLNDKNSFNGLGVSIEKIDELVSRYSGQAVYDNNKKSLKGTFTVKPGAESKITWNKNLTPGNYEVWYENEASLKSKLDLVKIYDIKGTASWSLGQELQSTWDWYNTYLNNDERVVDLKINNISIDKSSPVEADTKIKYTVDAEGNDLKYAYHVYKGRDKVYYSGYTNNNTFEYTPNEPGTYKVRVFVKDVYGNYVARYASGIEVIEPIIIEPELKIISVTPDKVSPVEVENNVKWTVEAEGNNLKYSYHVYNGREKVYKTSYINNKAFEYTPIKPGTYKVRVFVKDESGNIETRYASGIEVIKPSSIEPKLEIVSITPDKVSPAVGTKVKWTVGADGNNLKYSYHVYNGSEKVYKTSYISNNTFEYTPDNTGIYKVRVFVKDESGNLEARYASGVEVIRDELRINSVDFDKDGLVEVGTEVKYIVDVNRNNLKYAYHVYNGRNKVYYSGYKNANTFKYTPSKPGIYKVRVFVKGVNGNYVARYSKGLEVIGQ